MARAIECGWSLARLFGLAVCLAGLALCQSAIAEDGDGPAHYTIAVHVSSNPTLSEDPGEVAAIRAFVTKRAERINAEGGILGLPLRIRFFNDDLNHELTIKNIRETLDDPSVIAIVGVWSSSRGQHIVVDVGNSGIPFISEMSVETLFEDYPNIYTLTRSTRAEKEVFKALAKERGFNKIAFVGTVDDLYTRTFHTHLAEMGRETDVTGAPVVLRDGPEIVSTYWLDGEIEDNEQSIKDAIEEMKAKKVDMIFLSIRSVPGAKFLAYASDAGLSIPVFVALGSVHGIIKKPGGQRFRGPIYEVAEGGIANLNNERLMQLMRETRKTGALRNWEPNQIGYGARYSDLVVLAAEAAREAKTREVASVRAAVNEKLARLRDGRGSWSGLAQDWSFTDERASAERNLIVWRPPGDTGSILAPMQFIRTESGMVRVPVLYVHLDMVRVFGVDSNLKSFEAEFFFTMRWDGRVPMKGIEFTNAYRGPNSKEPIISIRQVHEDKPDAKSGLAGRIYKVSGRFTFEPDLRRYPFDEQVFSISFQPTTTSSAFFLQPPSEGLRNQDFDVDGWRVRNHYVGTNDLIIRSIAGPLSEERVIPYYSFNYTWQMKRQVIDYVLRVIVPLSCILIVAYLAVFIPRAEFNATIAIQVTALLSAIALYFALNQPQADDATLSDIIFVISYAVISLMIALSILEVNTFMQRSAGVVAGLWFTQKYIVPLVTLSLLGYLIFSAAYDEGPMQALMRTFKIGQGP